MNHDLFIDVCGPSGAARLARTSDGTLFVNSEGRWFPYDFNAVYERYYPTCTFTALTYENDLFWLAGVDSSGWPHLFNSLQGSVWEQKILTMQDPLQGGVQTSGKIVRILWDGERQQVHLVCQNGQLVTLPDCPRCVRIRQIECGVRVVDGFIEGGYIVFRFADGRERRVLLEETAQYRISMSYMRQLLAKGAVLVDLRTAAEHALGDIPESVNVSLDELYGWLSTQDKNRIIIFVCHMGMNSDLAVKLARRLGFTHAYSLGGTNALTHVV